MKKRIASVFLSLALLLCLVPGTARAEALTPTPSSNVGMQNYNVRAAPVYSYLTDTGNGTMTRVEYIEGTVYVEQYNAGYALQSRKTIPGELPLFGGFYAGPDNYFLVFGQTNPQEDNQQEVIRVVKYTKDWKRVGAASLLGANTTIPFRSGSLRMVQYGDMLYVRTCHQMYTSSDGRNHQANLTFSVDVPSMTVTDAFYKVMNIGWGYASHSFNQFIAVDGDRLVAVDHGDAHPRSVVLGRYAAAAGETTFVGYYSSTAVLPIKGATGDNFTGVSVGGFEVSGAAYLVAGNSIDQSTDSTSNVRNIFVTCTPKDGFPSAETTIRWLTHYTDETNGGVSTPQLVKISEEEYMLLWTTGSYIDAKLNYVLLDGSGSQVSRVYTASGRLSDCKPVFINGKVTWYVTTGGAPVFYSIDPDDPAVVNADPCDGGANCPSGQFRDVDASQWFHLPVDFVVKRGLMNGTTLDTFAPGSSLTRGMLVTILYRYEGAPALSRENPFGDVEPGQYYAGAVLWASENGIVNGVAPGVFNPNGVVTREQLVTILYRYAQYKNAGTLAQADLGSFSDSGLVSEYARPAFAWTVSQGIITGSDGCLRPQGSASRAEVAAVLQRYILNVMET